jgi:hypothetical protein
MRIAVLGTYRSGSSAVAGILHHLGVDMGKPFWQPLTPGATPYYESASLGDQLRLWWEEPALQEKTPKAERVPVLAQWVEGQERAGAKQVGAKHPLLSLCGEDLLEAWGDATHFIWSHRPLEESIHSLTALGWWPGSEEFVQRQLRDAASRFFERQPHLRVELADLTSHPSREVDRIIQYLRIAPDNEQIRSAVGCIQPRNKPPGA